LRKILHSIFESIPEKSGILFSFMREKEREKREEE